MTSDTDCIFPLDQDGMAASFIECLDVVFLSRSDRYLSVRSKDADILLVDFSRDADTSERFKETIEGLRPNDCLRLVDVTVDEGILVPQYYILEADFLMDCSSLSECYQPQGHHPLNFILSRFRSPESTLPILMGNLVNLMLDECVNRRHEASYRHIISLFFRQQALQIAACKPMGEEAKARKFHQEAQMHLANIFQVLDDFFPSMNGGLDPTRAILEPSYLCPKLGLQGRLDYMQQSKTCFIEMKSGKADEQSCKGRVLPKENHRCQMLLYQAMMQYTLGVAHDKVQPFLLYTKYPTLYPVRSSWNQLKEILNLRNRIVMNEKRVLQESSCRFTDHMLRSITPENLNERHCHGLFYDRYLSAPARQFHEAYTHLTDVERAYFLEHYNFITKEQYLAKCGAAGEASLRSMSRLWRLTLEQKLSQGEILPSLRLLENHASDPLRPSLLLGGCGVSEMESVPNFRQGDAVVLYQMGDDGSDASSRLVFKGTYEEVSDGLFRVLLRQSQSNAEVLAPDAMYAIEHDAMDVSIRSLYQALGAFLGCSRDRRDLILGLRKPAFDGIKNAEPDKDDFDRVARKALSARDLFLLIGPPGSGKTSRALRTMVDRFYALGQNLLLVSYTNRAEDEVCRMLEGWMPDLNYIRIGKEQAAQAAYRPHMIENVLNGCASRSDVVERLQSCRVFVGTISSLSSHSSLFRIKHFDVALVDEATQILETQMLGLLCQTDEQGGESIKKFVLIGDHKQLPSVVLQTRSEAQVRDLSLLALGIENLAESFFERLIRPCLRNMGDSGDVTSSEAFDMLRYQGRMHPDVAAFANRYFYQGLLRSLQLPHQVSSLTLPEELRDEPLSGILLERISFVHVDSKKHASDGAPLRTNPGEARMAALLSRLVFLRYGKDANGFDADRTLGIITPFRSQIALIRKEIRALGIPELEGITIDTVERFQGSERDVIIYSFSVNEPGEFAMIQNLITENGMLIDRKLNVALTRARSQVMLLGSRGVLEADPVCRSLLQVASEPFKMLQNLPGMADDE